LETKRLNYFVHVAELGSFTKASIVLGVEQSVLSRHVSQLEKELGLTLFYRDGRGVRLTPFGEELLERGRPILGELSKLARDISALARAPVGRVRLGLPHSVARVLAPPLINSFGSSYPKISLEIVEGLSGSLHEWFVACRLDVVVLYAVPAARNLLAEPLVEEDLSFVCRPQAFPAQGESVPFSSLANVPLVLPRRAHGLRILVESSAHTHGVPLNIAFEIDGVDTLRELVLAGQACSLLPIDLVRREVESGELIARTVVEPALTRTLLLVVASQRPHSDPSHCLARMVKSVVGDLISSRKWSARLAPDIDVRAP
jgi:LysR family nitrogen assimilation transcriptional regulator